MTYLLTGCSSFLLGYTVATVYRVWCMRQMQETWIQMLSVNNDTTRLASAANRDREIAEILAVTDLPGHDHRDNDQEIH